MDAPLLDLPATLPWLEVTRLLAEPILDAAPGTFEPVGCRLGIKVGHGLLYYHFGNRQWVHAQLCAELGASPQRRVGPAVLYEVLKSLHLLSAFTDLAFFQSQHCEWKLRHPPPRLIYKSEVVILLGV